MTGDQVGVLIAALLLCGCGVLVVWLARRGRSGQLPRNRVAGVRTSVTLSSDAAWDAAHRASARATEIAGWGTLAAGAVTAVVVIVVPGPVIVVTVLLLAGAAWLVTWSLLGAAQAQRAAHVVVNGGR